MERKEFVQLLAGAPFAFAHGLDKKSLGDSPKDLSSVKILQVKPYIFKNAFYVKLESDSGINGLGEAIGTKTHYGIHL